MPLKALDDRALGHVAEYFRALSEPLRLKILNALRDKARNVGELTDLLECSQANVSKHLATLTRYGFVERTTQDTNAFYRIADPRFTNYMTSSAIRWPSTLPARPRCSGPYASVPRQALTPIRGTVRRFSSGDIGRRPRLPLTC